MNTTGKRPSKAEGLSASTWKGFVKSWQAGLEKAISLQQRFPLEMVLSEKLSEHTANRMLAAYTHTHDLLHHLQDDFFSCKHNPWKNTFLRISQVGSKLLKFQFIPEIIL